METVSNFLSERKARHDILSPGNKLPGYYPASLRDDKDLSPVGTIDSSSVLQKLSQNGRKRKACCRGASKGPDGGSRPPLHQASLHPGSSFETVSPAALMVRTAPQVGFGFRMPVPTDRSPLWTRRWAISSLSGCATAAMALSVTTELAATAVKTNTSSSDANGYAQN
jgi:hypothetical protein